MTMRNSDQANQIKTGILPIMVMIVVFIYLWLVIRAWPNTWDDSAITLAFSRNLARLGDIVPTALTPRVEGYSSFLWMMINAAFFRVGYSSEAVLTIAKILSSFFAVANIVMVWKLIQARVITPIYQIGLLCLYAINSYTIASAVDGMETSLYALLVLLSFLIFKKRASTPLNQVLFCLATTLLILIRHEGPLFILPFGLVLLYEKRTKIFLEPCIYFWAAVFFSYHAWHFAFFGEWLTNPMLAKRHWPYRPEFENFSIISTFYLTPFFDFLFRYIGLVILLAASNLYIAVYRLQYHASDRNLLLVSISVVSLFIMSITGSNWGAAARLSYPGLPFLFLLL